jgi:hypothetical protein
MSLAMIKRPYRPPQYLSIVFQAGIRADDLKYSD